MMYAIIVLIILMAIVLVLFLAIVIRMKSRLEVIDEALKDLEFKIESQEKF